MKHFFGSMPSNPTFGNQSVLSPLYHPGDTTAHSLLCFQTWLLISHSSNPDQLVLNR